MFRVFDAPWICLCASRICAAYPALFNDWCDLASGTPSKVDLGIKSHWRRKGEDAIVIPGIYGQMLATQAGAQLAGVWTFVVTCRNLRNIAVLTNEHHGISKAMQDLVEPFSVTLTCSLHC